MPLRIGVDATSWSNRRGYGRFERNAVGRLIEMDGDNHYVLYLDDENTETSPPRACEQQRLRLTRPIASAASRRPLRDLLRLSLTASRDDLDVFLFPSIYTYFPVVGVPTVVGVHDLTPRLFPELTLPTRRARLFWRLKEGMAVRRAARIFTVSEAARAALTDSLELDPARVAVVPEAPDPVFRRRGRREVRRLLRSIDLEADDPFLLYAGGISPHKNLETLLDAYVLLRKRGKPPRLVIAGALEDDPFLSASERVRERIRALELERDVILTGFVSDEVLSCLYNACVVVVFPSLSEGFGLPPVEAAACQAPVLVSDLPAHRETMGETALYFPSRDAPALADTLTRMLADGSLRSSLAEAGRRRVSSLSWDAAADRLRSLLIEAAEARHG
jgi:glycosyltransferase involved in cell wall biosynthesis